MALNESASFVVALLLAVLTFSSMQILRPHLVATKAMTIVAGFLGSIVFVFLLTALANLEKVVFGRGFSTKWFEVVLCLLVSIAAAGSVHKVSATTAALFSACMLYYLNKLSQVLFQLL